MNELTTILIADDHRMIAQAVAEYLKERGGFRISTTENLVETLNVIQSTEDDFDVVLLDLKMPGMNGLESIEKVVNRAGQGKVVLFSGNADHGLVRRSLSIGALGLVPKSMPLDVLANVIGLVKAGQVFLPADFSQHDDRSRNSGSDLSGLERDILVMVSEGQTNKEIANHCQVTEMNIKMHMRTICAKLDAKNRTHAVVIARESQLI